MKPEHKAQGPERNGRGKPQAAPEETPNSEESQGDSTQKEAGGAPADLMRFGFHDETIRVVMRGGEPWFVAADVCRALGLSPRNGSFSLHITKLDADDKQQVRREVALSQPPAHRFNGEVVPPDADPPTDPADGSPAADRAASIWIISEAGLYTLVLRNRGATTPETVAYRFRRRVTKEVLPAIRRTGSYSTGGGADDKVTITLDRRLARYIVTALSGEPAHVRRAEIGTVIDEMDLLDACILCHTLKTIECWWHQAGDIRSFGSGPTGGMLFEQLAQAILNGGKLADRFLGFGPTRKPARPGGQPA